jgi:integrase
MISPATYEEDEMRTMTRASDSRGRPVSGIYVRDGRFIGGAKIEGRWTLHTLDAETLTEARRERESWVTGLREGRIPTPARATFDDVFTDWQEARPKLSERTRKHERHVAEKRLGLLLDRRVQTVTSTEIAAVLREQAKRYAPYSCAQTFRLLSGTFAHATRRGVITRDPMAGLATSERPEKRAKRDIARLDAEPLNRLVAAADSERWRAAFGLAGYAGLRLGELRGLRWDDVDLEAATITVRRSLLPDGTEKATKTEAGERSVPLLPSLRRLLVAWKLRAPYSRPDDLVIGTADGGPVQERTVGRAFARAKTAAGLDGLDERLSVHALRHSFASMLATDLNLAPTTLAQLIGHADAGFTLRVYARDARDTATVVEDVLKRAASAGVGE